MVACAWRAVFTSTQPSSKPLSSRHIHLPNLPPPLLPKTNVTVFNSGESDAHGEIRLSIVDNKGAAVTSTQADFFVPQNASVARAVNIPLSNMALWTLDAPTLYYAVFNVTAGSAPTQTVTLHFGVRTIAFDADKGFQLNGKSMKMQGGCVHHDNGPLGAAAIDRADERRVEQLKSLGYTAIRTSHNPVSPAFLDACDRLGVLVMEEAFDCWEHGKKPDDYHNYFDAWWQRDMEVGGGGWGGGGRRTRIWEEGHFLPRHARSRCLRRPALTGRRLPTLPPSTPRRWSCATDTAPPSSCGPLATRFPCATRPRACSCPSSCLPTCAAWTLVRAVPSPRPCPLSGARRRTIFSLRWMLPATTTR